MKILLQAQRELARLDRLAAEQRKVEIKLKTLCKEYDLATGCRGTTLVHLRKAVRYDLPEKAAC